MWCVVFRTLINENWNYFPHRSRIFIKVRALQGLIQELAHHWDVPNCLSDKIPCTFSSNFVVPIIKIEFKCSCDTEVRYLDVMYFSKLRHSKEAAKRFIVAVQRTRTLTSLIIWKASHLIVLWLNNQLRSLDLFRGPDGSYSRNTFGPRAIGLRPLH